MIRHSKLKIGPRAAGAALFLFPCLLGAQTIYDKPAESGNWEVGADGGYGYSRQVSVGNSTASGQTGFSSNYALGAVFGNNTFRYFGGELRYTFRQDELQVSSGNTKAVMSGQSHALHYDALIYAAPRHAAVRPFLALGGGIKDYRGTGPGVAYQPLSNLILLTHTSDLKPLLTAGGGVKFAVSQRCLVRLDVRDYMTPFPKQVLTPFGSRAGGWIHDIAFLIGVSTAF